MTSIDGCLDMLNDRWLSKIIAETAILNDAVSAINTNDLICFSSISKTYRVTILRSTIYIFMTIYIECNSPTSVLEWLTIVRQCAVISRSP